MWLSLNILNKLVDLNGISPEEISEKLTMSTAETEGIEYSNSFFDTIVAAKLVSVDKHPDSDHLTVVKADTGKEVYDVVCGATNHKEGDIVPLALVGTKLSEDFEIKKSKIRGVNSNGMLCSAKELGLSDDHSGIMILDPSTQIGKPLSEIIPEWVDTLIEIDNKSITHRPDLWGHYGFARELAALFKRELKDPVDMELVKTFPKESDLSVTIECPENAFRYAGLIVKNIKIGESPDWLKSAVTSIGMRPVNNIVDITNYVMAEIGEPMHAFSRDKLEGNQIKVRMAQSGETLMTLDGQERNLTTEDIVIADSTRPIAIAGVMGGGNSEIDETTEEIVLEAATFDSVHVRKTAHRFNLRTDAAMRFEKSLDPELCDRAIVRCYQLIKEIIPAAEAVSPIIDAYPNRHTKLHIEISTNYIRERLGEAVTDKRIIEILEGLEYDVTAKNDLLSIDVPTYRATKDVEIEADIVEEIGRVYGYDNITPSAPLVPCETPEHNYLRELERKIKLILSRDVSMIEVYNYSFTGEHALQKAGVEGESQLRLKNPLSVEHDRLRNDLVPGLLENTYTNAKHSRSAAFYELGRTYHKKNRNDNDLAKEEYIAAGVFYTNDSNQTPFYDAKHAVTLLLEKLKIKNYIFTVPVQSEEYVHPRRSLTLLIEGNDAGRIFEVNPIIQNRFDIEGRTAVFDIHVNALLSAQKKPLSFEGIRKYPDVHFEVSVISPVQTYSTVLEKIIQNSSENVVDVDVISVYTGEPVPEGFKSISYKITFNGMDHTLSTDETVNLQNSVVKNITSNGFELR
jgi:phenylalanyl-tRNA synthetase beta chain